MLSGYKTYITGAVTILVAIAALLGYAPDALHADPMALFSIGFGMIFTRAAIAK